LAAQQCNGPGFGSQAITEQLAVKPDQGALLFLLLTGQRYLAKGFVVSPQERSS
jgi:hypothetical protein